MQSLLMDFHHSQRSAVAIIFALSFVPLMMLVGLSVDYTYYAEARAQEFLAAEAAATHAVRTAASTFELEVLNGTAGTVATNDAYVAGAQAGSAWFSAQLGKLPRGSVLPPSQGQPRKAPSRPAPSPCW